MRLFQPGKPPYVRLPPRSNFEILMARGAQAATIVVGVLAIAFALYQGKFVLAPVTLAIIVGLMLGPVATRIERLGISPWISSAIVFLLFVTIVFTLVMALWSPLSFWIGQAPQIWEQLQFRLEQLREPMQAVGSLRERIRELTGDGGSVMTVAVEEGSAVESVAVLAPAILAQVLLFLGSLYFFVATRQQTRNAILKMCLERRLRWRVAHVFRDVEGLVSRYLLSIAMVNLGLGVAVTAVLWALGVPSPALWGALAGLLNFIMYIGPAIMAALLFAVGLASYDTLSAALVPPLAYLAVNMIEAQFATPAVLGRTLTLNPFTVLLALTFWIWMWGPVGGFVAIPILLIFIAIIRNVVPSSRSERGP